jgi:hypothetical protein
MTTAISTLSEFPSGKEQVEKFVKTIKSEILANDRDPLPILVQLKYIEKTISEILKDDEIDNHFLNQFLLYNGEKVIEVAGAKLSKSEVGVKYDYKASGDQIYNDLVKKMGNIKEKIEERETFLKVLPEGGLVCPVHGNFLTRPPKSSKTKVIVKL